MSEGSITSSRAWCVFRNLVHTVYREARHLGPSRDPEAKVTVPDDEPLAAAAKRCRTNRKKLKSNDLHGSTASARSPAEVLAPYQEMTGLSVDNMVTVFELPNWNPGYGGAKWARIAATLMNLLSALEADDMERANRIGSEVSSLRHNSGPLRMFLHYFLMEHPHQTQSAVAAQLRPFPRQPLPMLLQKADAMSASPDWTYEPKWDGFRVLASIRDDHVRLVSRNGHSFTNFFGPVSDALRGIPTSILLDGEVIVINDKGQPDFEALRHD